MQARQDKREYLTTDLAKAPTQLAEDLAGEVLATAAVAKPADADFCKTLTMADISILALGASRLEEAADWYITTGGVAEAETFPSEDDTQAGIALNILRVQQARDHARLLKMRLSLANWCLDQRDPGKSEPRGGK